MLLEINEKGSFKKYLQKNNEVLEVEFKYHILQKETTKEIILKVENKEYDIYYEEVLPTTQYSVFFTKTMSEIENIIIESFDEFLDQEWENKYPSDYKIEYFHINEDAVYKKLKGAGTCVTFKNKTNSEVDFSIEEKHSEYIKIYAVDYINDYIAFNNINMKIDSKHELDKLLNDAWIEIKHNFNPEGYEIRIINRKIGLVNSNIYFDIEINKMKEALLKYVNMRNKNFILKDFLSQCFLEEYNQLISMYKDYILKYFKNDYIYKEKNYIYNIFNLKNFGRFEVYFKDANDQKTEGKIYYKQCFKNDCFKIILEIDEEIVSLKHVSLSEIVKMIDFSKVGEYIRFYTPHVGGSEHIPLSDYGYEVYSDIINNISDAFNIELIKSDIWYKES